MVNENTYFAELHIHRAEDVIQVDARPSDSIAVALRLKAPIFTSRDLLDLPTEPLVESQPDPSSVQTLDAESLKEYLSKLNPEDFGKFAP